METAESLVYRQIRRILTIMTPGETGGMEIEINLSPEGAPLKFTTNKKKRLLTEPFFHYKLIKKPLRSPKTSKV